MFKMKNHFCFVDGFLVSLHSRRKHSFSFLFMLRFWSYSQGSLPNPLCRALVFSNVYLDLDAVIQFFSGQRSASLFIYFSSLKDFSFESNCSYPDSSCTHISSEFRNSDTFIIRFFPVGLPAHSSPCFFPILFTPDLESWEHTITLL